MRKMLKIRELSCPEKENLWIKHRGLVHFVAEKHLDESPIFDIGDLTQEGVMGLFDAGERFNPERHYRFSSYAIWWIRHRITRALTNNGHLIHIPQYIIEGLTKYKKTRENLLQKLGRRPLTREIAEAMGVGVKRVQHIKDFLRKPPSFLSLEHLGGSVEDDGDEEGPPQFLIEDKRASSPVISSSENLSAEELKKDIEVILDERERKIVKLRFGLTDGVSYNPREIAEMIGISRERVRQIINESLEKLKKHQIYKVLKLKSKTKNPEKN